MVYATGSERVVGMLRPGAAHFEYRHTPDPREIDQILLPMLETHSRRRTRARAPDPARR